MKIFFFLIIIGLTSSCHTPVKKETQPIEAPAINKSSQSEVQVQNSVLRLINSSKVENESFEERIVDFAIEQKSDRAIEIKDLYDSLTNYIPDDADEKLILVQILKRKGFKITNWGRGNFFQGPRIISITLKKDNCECNVVKYYYQVLNDSTFLRSESISCK